MNTRLDDAKFRPQVIISKGVCVVRETICALCCVSACLKLCANSQKWLAAKLPPLFESLDNSKRRYNNLQELIGRKHFIEIPEKFLTLGHIVYFRP